MTTERFILNGKYLIDPTMNLVRDLTQDEGIRLETRVMALLCLLAENPGKLVPREKLVKTIWNDYGGADEALTQSVSHLRKVLQDTGKTIIETIPKKGYVLHASLAAPESQFNAPKATPPVKRPKSWLRYASLMLIICAFVLWSFFDRSANSQPSDRSKAKTTAVPFQEVSKPVDEDYANTITTVGPDRARYKLIVHGDSRPAFYINDRLLTPDEMEGYLDLIRQLATKLKQRQKESAGQPD